MNITMLGPGYDVSSGGTVLHQIPGGVHAQFGPYGPRAVDGMPAISAEARREETVDYIVEFFTQNGWL